MVVDLRSLSIWSLSLLSPGFALAADQEVPDSVGAEPNVVVNPDLVTACGLDFVLVADESGSIDLASAIGDVRQAATEFVSSLADTSSSIAVVEFSSKAGIAFGASG